MSSRKKILIIAGYDIYPVYFGGAYGQTVYIDKQQYQHDITLLISPDNVRPHQLEAFKQAFPAVKIITTKNYADIAPKPKKKYGFFGKKIYFNKPTGYFDGVEKNIALLFKCREDVAAILPEVLAQQAFDLVQIEHTVNLGLVSLIPPHIPKVYIHPEIFHTRIAQELLAQGYDAAYVQYLSGCVKATEYGLLQQYDAIFAVSGEDKQFLHDTGITRPVYTSVSPIYEKEMKRLYKPDAAPVFVFMGSESHYPNRHGLEWFYREVYPILQQKNIPFKLLVTGWWSRWFVKRYEPKGCVFTGFVDDLDTILHNAILINPVTMGSGLRMKIIVAMSRGVPVVSTSPGAAGTLGIVSGHNILLADSAAGFAAAIEQVSNDASLRTTLSQNGYQLVNEQYNQQHCVANRNSHYEQICQNKKV
jgi:glycosyltransferase involved in cell wall biosynthesis